MAQGYFFSNAEEALGTFLVIASFVTLFSVLTADALSFSVWICTMSLSVTLYKVPKASDDFRPMPHATAYTAGFFCPVFNAFTA